MARAERINVFRDKWFTTIEYRYRGCKYEVQYANGWQVCCTPAWIQHRDEQAKIDEMLDHPKPVPKKNHKPFQEQLDEVWKMLEWD